MCTSRRQRGLTLIELIMFIVIVSVALVGVLTVLNITAKSSADPMIRKQALAVAEAVLEEVMLQPFTWCDPNDTNAATAINYTTCSVATAAQNTVTAKAGEARGTATPLDNVFDYNAETISTNIAGGGTAPFPANVTVAAAAFHDITAISGAALLITVTVAAGNETIQLQGYRARHSPNLLP
ncbi:MAG: prepilin-type N-terminal cleavage/methylation domain-containing protein [Burkholderiaceae bacterium]|nr:prepilin-type N-terminal cleavage/methylation domain-containing protein [Sulfuritalea sp.]MCF8174665.1 prepilin-type N-terminal cleavage/methylation domain-containing protein [Burkholderiaceae bacterium]